MKASSLVIAVGALSMAPLASPANAQLAGSATLESQSVYRGVPVDNGEPDVSLGGSYDHPSGAYLGVSGTVGLTANSGVRPLGYVTYLGFARRDLNRLTWDVGLTISEYTTYLSGRPAGSSALVGTYSYHAPYREAYIGMSDLDWNARLYLSPNYRKAGAGAAYLDLTRTIEMSRSVRVYIHAGLVTPFGGSDRPGADRERFDEGAGCAFDYRSLRFRVGWTRASPAVLYPQSEHPAADRAIVGVSRYF